MITNFESITYDFTDDEKLLFPILITWFKGVQKSNPIKEPDILIVFNQWLPKNRPDISCKLTGARLRKMINRIRNQSVIPIIGTSKGYYVSYDQEEIRLQIQSLKERAESINAAANGLMEFLRNKSLS